MHLRGFDFEARPARLFSGRTARSRIAAGVVVCQASNGRRVKLWGIAAARSLSSYIRKEITGRHLSNLVTAQKAGAPQKRGPSVQTKVLGRDGKVAMGKITRAIGVAAASLCRKSRVSHLLSVNDMLQSCHTLIFIPLRGPKTHGHSGRALRLALNSANARSG